MAVVSSPTRIGCEDVLLHLWNSSADRAFLIRGDSHVTTYAPDDAEVNVVLPPLKSIFISTLEWMNTEDDAEVSWLSVSGIGESDGCQVFVLMREDGGVRTAAAPPPTEAVAASALLWDSDARIDGLAPFKRVTNYVLVPQAVDTTPSPLATRIAHWMGGNPWNPPDSPMSTGSSTTPA